MNILFIDDTEQLNKRYVEIGEVMGCGLKVFPPETAEEIHEVLFPEDFEEGYEEYRERMRHLYSVLMSEGELNMHFP